MSIYERPLYLHFLDRELGDSAGFHLSGDALEKAVKILLLTTATRFYCGVSLAWESPAVDQQRVELLSLLIATANLDLVSHHVTEDEFLETRRTLYAHDSDRYPAYFSNHPRSGLIQTQYKTEGTTDSLARAFEEAIDTGRSPVVLSDDARRAAERPIATREDRAITFALFEPELARRGASERTRYEIRRAVSVLYCHHYLAYLQGDLPTGIAGLTYFESALPHSFPLADLSVLEVAVRRIGLGVLIDQPWARRRQFWGEVATIRRDDPLAQEELSRLLLALDPGGSGTDRALHSRRLTLEDRLRAVLAPLPAHFQSPSGRLNARPVMLGMMAAFASALGRLPRDGRAPLPAVATPLVDVLLVTATDSEDQALHDVIQERFRRRPSVVTVGTMSFEDLGRVGGQVVWHVRCEMGATGPAGATLTIFEAIDRVHPSAVIMLGIAFGVDSKRQPIGTVLVASSVYPYTFVRASTSRWGRLRLQPRGHPAPATPHLVSRFRLAARHAPPAEVGVVLSGDALVDNVGFRRAIARLSQEKPIGGEMEGYGLYSAASKRQKSWILVKAVCDWADGRKREDKAMRQQIAARRSAHFVLDVLEQSGRELFAGDRSAARLSPG